MRPPSWRRASRAAVGHGVEIVLVHGASAIVDRRDVIPAAVVAAGGRIEHFGMPVDPGNLLLLGHVGERVGAGPAGLRPLAQGQRLRLGARTAGRRACRSGREDIMRMGGGGLLAEIPSRPLPRAEAEPDARAEARGESPPGPRIAALLLAAGQSRRMGGPNKLLAEIDGTPMVARTAQRLLASRARPDRRGARQPGRCRSTRRSANCRSSGCATRHSPRGSRPR